jgi:L-lysine 6-transaminase
MFRTRVTPGEVRAVLKKHMLADGYEQVLDLEKSHGSWIVDARDGREYCDLFSFYASMPLGMNHPKMVNDEVIRHRGRLALNKPTNSDIYTTTMAEFVETFGRVGIPDSLPYLFLVEGGSVAIENLVKAAFDWKVRKNLQKGIAGEKGQKILHFRECFHGRTGYALSMTDSNDPNKTLYFPKFSWPRVTNPKISFPLNEENLEKVRLLEEQAVGEVQLAFRENPDDIAAILIEPIQAEGGDHHFRPEFLRKLRELADENDALFLVDEVQTGMGLTGSFWCYPQMGVEVDGLAFGKKMQVCGILMGRRLDEVEDHVFQKSSRINSTWGGNLVDMARSRFYLEILEEEDILGHVRTLGPRLLERLRALEQELPGFVANTRGRGLLCALDLPDAEIRREVLTQARAEGVFILPCGIRTIRFRPALNIPADVLDEGFERFARAVRKTAAAHGAGKGEVRTRA